MEFYSGYSICIGVIKKLWEYRQRGFLWGIYFLALSHSPAARFGGMGWGGCYNIQHNYKQLHEHNSP